MPVLAQLNMTIEKHTINDKSSHFKFVTFNLEKAIFLPGNSISFFALHYIIHFMLQLCVLPLHSILS